MNKIKTIVEALNAEPWNMGLTLVSFHTKTPTELLQVVTDVFAELDPKQKVDVRDEEDDATAIRMLEFIMVLNYRHEMELGAFKEALMKGVQNIIYPMLCWIFERLPSLKKRAYLARYLRLLEVPEEFFADQAIVGRYQKYKELQTEFKEVHKVVDKIRPEAVQPAQLQSEIDQLELEREQLQAKLKKLRSKISKGGEYDGVDNFDEILKATHKVRKEQEEEAKLYQQLHEQKGALARSEQLQQVEVQKLRELQRSNFANQDPQTLLEKLRSSVKETHEKDEKLEKELRARNKQLHELSRMMTSDPMTEEQVDDLEREIDQLEDEVAALTQRRDSLLSSDDGKIGFYRDRLTAAEKKKEKLLEQLQELEDEKAEADDELNTIATEMKTLTAGRDDKPKSEAEMKQYMKQLAKKTKLCKQYKDELASMRQEVSVLSRTSEILRSRATDLEGYMRDLEKEKGVEGYQTTQAQLEDVSANKSKYDVGKGQTLDEISRVVADITKTLKARKSKLTPQIKELRSIRNTFDDVEAEYKAKKQVYDNTVLGYEGERLRLQQDVDANINTMQEQERSYHVLNCMSNITEARVAQVTAEVQYQRGQGQFTETSRTYKDLYDKQIREQEALSKTRREETKGIKQTHTSHVQQRSVFKTLRDILQMKLRLTQEAAARQSGEGEGGTDYLSFDTGNGQAMVLEH